MNNGPALVSILRQGPYLIASIHTALDDSQMTRFRDDLVEQIGTHRSRGVIIDVAALDVLEMPSRIPFVREVYTWLMSSANGLTAQLEQNFLEAFQTVLKLILLITFMWVCVKLVNMGVLIIRAGVDLIRTAIEHSEDKVAKLTEQDRHF